MFDPPFDSMLAGRSPPLLPPLIWGTHDGDRGGESRGGDEPFKVLLFEVATHEAMPAHAHGPDQTLNLDRADQGETLVRGQHCQAVLAGGAVEEESGEGKGGI